MKEIKNLKEKRLIIARQIIINQTEPTDENITAAWCSLFTADKLRLNDPELFEWIRKHVGSNNVKSCNEQLERIRRKGEKVLKAKGKYVDYGAKLIKQPNNALAVYSIFTKGKKYSGNYDSLSRRMGQMPKKNTD